MENNKNKENRERNPRAMAFLIHVRAWSTRNLVWPDLDVVSCDFLIRGSLGESFGVERVIEKQSVAVAARLFASMM